MHVNSTLPGLKQATYRRTERDFTPLGVSPFGTRGDGFERSTGAPRFEGRVSESPYLKGFLTLALGLGSLLNPLGGRISQAHDGHDQEIPPPREYSVRVEPQRMGLFAQPDVKRYEHIENLYKTLKDQPKGSWDRSQTVQRIRNSWNALANDARNGNASAKMSLQALWANRMTEELTEPSEYLVRVDYPEYEELVDSLNSGQLSREDFKTELQWRALIGLYCYYRNGIPENSLTENVDRLYEPVTKLLASNPHPKIQTWGGSLMNTIFPRLDTVKQQEYLENTGQRYFSAEPGSAKLSAMKAVNWLYQDSASAPFWKSFIPKLGEDLKTLLEDPEQTQNEAIKYHVTTLGMLKAPESSDMLRRVLSREYSLEAQGAAAWSLGRVQSKANFDKLLETVQDSRFDTLVRENAIYSLAEYATQYDTQVWEMLNGFKADSAQNEPQALKEAARAMRDMLTDRSLTEPDYYINKLLKTDAEKTQFRGLRDQYVTGLEKLNIGQKNMVDRALLPYRHFLQDVINQGGKHHIISGVVTDLPTYKSYFGQRIHDGRLNDTIEGMSSSTAGAVTNKNRINPAIDNTFAHEFLHHIHQLVMNDDELAWKVLKRTGLTRKIEAIYQRSMADKRVLDYYGANNEYENLAQGGAAIDALYLKHSQLYNSFFNRGYDSGADNGRSKLKRQDPELYRFLESIRCIPLDISLNLIKSHAPELYAQIIAGPAKDNTQNVA